MSSSSDDNEQTVIKTGPGTEAAPRDSVSNSSLFGHTLPEGTKLGEFEITGLIGEGGFGIVYLAYDPSLEREVAIKEYMPSALASRASSSVTVAPKSDRHRDTFKAGLRSFVNEARLLARFDHPALVKVYRFWEANGTAYMVMPYYQGPTLKQALAQLPLPPSEMALRDWLKPLLDALRVMHESNCYHRDIAPDNILLTPAGPLLLDFGAARRVVGDMTHALTVVLKPGYAPIEQYGEAAAMAQGAWTDLYALASVVYYAIVGRTPMSSVERMMDDRLPRLAEIGAGRYGDGFLCAMDAALALRPQDRPQSVAAFQELLDRPSEPAGLDDLDLALPTMPLHTPATVTVPVPPTVAPSPAPAPPVARTTAPAVPRTAAAVPRTAPVIAPAPAPAARTAWRPMIDDPISWSRELSAPVAPAPRSYRLVLLAGGLLVLAALGAAAWYLGDFGTPAPAVPAAELAVQPVAVEAAPPVAAPAPPVADIEPPATPPAAAAPPVAEVVAPPPAPVEPARARSETPPRNAATEAPVPAARAAKPADHNATASRCSDILQKASLEALSRAEADYLKRECR